MARRTKSIFNGTVIKVSTLSRLKLQKKILNFIVRAHVKINFFVSQAARQEVTL